MKVLPVKRKHHEAVGPLLVDIQTNQFVMKPVVSHKHERRAYVLEEHLQGQSISQAEHCAPPAFMLIS
jgi:hypothetical protein